MRNVVERAGESVVNLGRQTEFTYERKRHAHASWSNTAFVGFFFAFLRKSATMSYVTYT
jgi:hypothetical protein